MAIKKEKNAILQKAQFGKYKGKLISWIIENDFNYANWLMKQSNSNTATKRAVKSLINKQKTT